MSIPNLQIVLKTIRENYNCSLTTIKGKRIMFEGVSNNKKLVLCTPSSKLHPQGKGWFDLTTKQVELLDDSDISILAVRLEGGKVYYINFKDLRRLMEPEMILENPREGRHWKFYVWPSYLKVQGNEKEFHIQPEVVY
ncbi:hypothetical protein ACF3M2_09910 [Tissierella carlieri]|uniref:hypothetical protein n=1 Tax=Tissierella carlieri TaxID=689904 RepID=UPI0038694676